MNLSRPIKQAARRVFDLRGSKSGGPGSGRFGATGTSGTFPGWVSDPIRWALLCVLMVSLSACGSRRGEGTEQLLKERVTAYYEAYKAKDMLTVYQMESGSRPGGGLKPHEMQKRMVARIADYTLQGVNIKGNEGEATLSIGYLYGRLQRDPIYREIKDRWIFIDGVWYHETPKPGSPPGNRPVGKQRSEADEALRSSEGTVEIPGALEHPGEPPTTPGAGEPVE